MKNCIGKHLSFMMFLALFSQVSFANYLPLIGSEWALSHPGELPYEECHLVVSKVDQQWSGIVVSGGYDAYETFLSCSARSLGLEYLIPVLYYEKSIEGGLFLSLISRFRFENQAIVQHLDQKLVRDVFDKYHGFTIGGGIYLVGGEGAFLKNSSDIKIKTRAVTAGDILSIGSAGLMLSFNPSVSMAACRHPYVLINGNTSVKTAQNCVPNGPYDLSTARTPVGNDIVNLRFVKIKKNK